MADEGLKVQMSIRQNAEELQDMLKELNSWQDEMKIKDEDLRNSKTITKKVRVGSVLRLEISFNAVWNTWLSLYQNSYQHLRNEGRETLHP